MTICLPGPVGENHMLYATSSVDNDRQTRRRFFILYHQRHSIIALTGLWTLRTGPRIDKNWAKEKGIGMKRSRKLEVVWCGGIGRDLESIERKCCGGASRGAWGKSQQRQVGGSREKAVSCKGGSVTMAVDDILWGSWDEFTAKDENRSSVKTR